MASIHSLTGLIRTAIPAALVFLLAAGTAVGVTPQQWRLRLAADFEDGEFSSVSIGDDGALRLSPRLEELYAAPEPYIWSIVRDRAGNLYAGSGNEGQIFRIGPDGAGGVFHDTAELEVHALAIGPDDRLYAGTSPEGKVYRFDSAGEAEVFFDPGQTYIWDLAFLPGGDLLVATGPEGILYRVGPDGAGRPWFDAEDTHLRSLMVRADGSVAVGTAGGGLIVSIAPDGKPFVLFDSPQEEIVDLAEGPDGSLYAAALAPQKKARSSLIRPQQPGQPAPRPTPPQRTPPRVNFVYRIAPNGVTDELWRTTGQNLYRLLWSGDVLLVGTGEQGRLVALTPEGGESERIRLGSAQVTAIVPGDGGTVYLGSSNLGFVSRLEPGSSPAGEYVSAVKDTRTVSDWGNLTWKADLPRGASVRMQVRTGNTLDPDRTWSDWSEPSGEGFRIDRPRARYVQWKAILTAGRGDASPVLREVSLAYLQQNLAPKVTSVTVQGPGTRYQAPAATTSQQKSQQSSQAQKSGATGTAANSGSQTARPATPAPRPPRTSFQKGSRAVRWNATDPNGDTMLYSVYFRGEGEKLWKVLKEEIRTNYHSWDATAMPDGVYEIRVVATDAPSNPRGEALVGEKVSDSFFVDHTPPRVENLEADVRAGQVEVTFLATDSFSAIETAQYSIDARDWQALYPEDRVADSPSEIFRFLTEDLVSGEHTIVVRTTDEMGNSGSGKIVLEVP